MNIELNVPPTIKRGIIKVSYQRVFPLASYVNEKIGIEMEVYDGDAEGAFKECKEMVNNWGSQIENKWMTTFPEVPPPQKISSTITQIEAERTEIAIDNATTIHELDLLMGDAAKYGLHAELNAKKKQLNPKI